MDKDVKVYLHTTKTVKKKSVSKITNETKDITCFVQTITWSGAATEATRSLEISLINSPYDKEMKVPLLTYGDDVSLYEGGKRLFYGKIMSRSRQGDIGETTYTAKDYMYQLIKSHTTGKFKDKTPEYIAKALCKEAGIQAGNLIKTKKKVGKHYGTDNSIYAVIMKAYWKASAKTGIPYFPYMDGKKFCIKEKGALVGKGYNAQSKQVEENYILHQARNITGVTVTQNAEEAVTSVALYSKKGKKIGTVKNAEWVKKFGVLQEVQDSGNRAAAKKKLKGPKKEIQIEALGDQRCIAGAGVRIYDATANVTGVFWIESDTHTWSSTEHTMDLTLTFQNRTENPEMSYTAPEKKTKSSSYSGGGTVKSDIMNGKKVKALFTAYYPHGDDMEGGYLDANDHKLDPSKRTCAAPPEVDIGKWVQPIGIRGSRNKVPHKVNDRGGVIKIVNGRYRFDLLFGSKAACDRFGVRKGKAIIGNGTFKRKAVGGNKKADKIISKARKFLGKVHYVWGASKPQKGMSDCSGFVYYIFHKFGLISRRQSAADYATMSKGKRISKMSKLRKGDLVFCSYAGKRYGHVGIYISNGNYIHCTTTPGGVKISAVPRGRFTGGRRLL